MSCKPRASIPTPIVCIGGRMLPSHIARAFFTDRRWREATTKIFVLDLIGERLKSVDPKSIRGNVTAEKAEIRNVVTQPNPATGGWRLSFELSARRRSAGRATRIADAGQRCHIGGVGLSMDTLTQHPGFKPDGGRESNSFRRNRRWQCRSSRCELSSRAGPIGRHWILWRFGAAAFSRHRGNDLAGCYEMYEVLQVGGVTILEWMVLVCSCCCSHGSHSRSCRHWPASRCCCSAPVIRSASIPMRPSIDRQQECDAAADL
jgi:hypothetical protein